PLFLVLAPGVKLTAELEAAIRQRIRDQLSPRHVPNAMFVVPAIPRTLSGKKLEIPVRKILLGTPVTAAVNADSVANPDALQAFVGLAEELAAVVRPHDGQTS
ncbi:MAG: acetoacetate--CoA ligase, partial [Alicyclobacillus sp.]|nr:acetoacetate--CoA ligase [Alicyclobacillus sp.]